MSFVLSTNMNLSIPTVGQEPGPQYAFDVNTSLTLIDQHDHSPGRGVQITPAGLNINTSLDMQDNDLTNSNNIVFDAQTSSSVLQALYVKPGTETPPIEDLWYNDSNGTPVQLTSNGLVNATIASLPGESFAGGTFFWKQGTGSTTPANFDIGSITIRPNIALTTFGVTVTPPSAISSAYNIALPLLPASPSFLTIDNSGNITASPTTASFLPNNAGAQGYFYRQSSTGAPTWQTLNTTIQVKTSNYTATFVDDLILCSNSGSGFTVTLPTAVGIDGKVITIKKTDAPLASVITIDGNGSETIDGALTVKCNTQNETYVLCASGGNWQILDHKCDTNWSAYTLLITGVTTNPTQGAGATKSARWRRVGGNIEVQFYYGQTSVGTGGSGIYLFSLPVGALIDSSLFTVGTAPIGTLQDIAGLAQVSDTTAASSTTAEQGTAYAYNTGNIYIVRNAAGQLTAVQSASFGLNNTIMYYSFQISVPITNWTP